MPHRLRLRRHRINVLGAVQQLFELARHQAVVGGVVRHPQAHRLALHAAQHQVHPFRQASLHGAQQVRVHADLQHGGSRRLAGQLGVHNFVAPRTQVARRIDPLEEVRVPQPSLVQQYALVDHLRASSHGLPRGFVFRPDQAGRGHSVRRPDFGDFATFGAQLVQVARLVLLPAPCHAIQHGVVTDRTPDIRHQRRRAFEICQVPALQEAHQVGRRVGQTLVDQLHRGVTGPSATAGEVRAAPGMCNRRKRAAGMLREKRPAESPAVTD